MQQKPSFIITFSFVKLLKILANISRNNLSTWSCLVCECESVCVYECMQLSDWHFFSGNFQLNALSEALCLSKAFVCLPFYYTCVHWSPFVKENRLGHEGHLCLLFIFSCPPAFCCTDQLPRDLFLVYACVCTTGDELFRVKWDLLCSYLAPPFYSWTLLE